MRKVILSPAAEGDIASILAWSEESFGESARSRYSALVVRAIVDLALEPARPGVHDRSEIAAGVFSYALVHSRMRVGKVAGRVGTPRHFVLFRLRGDDAIEIVRVLHDSMDFPRHVKGAGE